MLIFPGVGSEFSYLVLATAAEQVLIEATDCETQFFRVLEVKSEDHLFYQSLLNHLVHRVVSFKP